MFKFNSFWGFIAACLTLVGLFLLLDRSSDASRLFRSGTNGFGALFGILQGRTAKVAQR